MYLVDESDSETKEVKRITVDDVEIFNFDTTTNLSYNMVDRLAADDAEGKTIVIEFN